MRAARTPVRPQRRTTVLLQRLCSAFFHGTIRALVHLSTAENTVPVITGRITGTMVLPKV
jgi:hypothetical protein